MTTSDVDTCTSPFIVSFGGFFCDALKSDRNVQRSSKHRLASKSNTLRSVEIELATVICTVDLVDSCSALDAYCWQHRF